MRVTRWASADNNIIVYASTSFQAAKRFRHFGYNGRFKKAGYIEDGRIVTTEETSAKLEKDGWWST